MNESQFESELGRLRPTAPAPEMADRIARELAASPGEGGLILRPGQIAEPAATAGMLHTRVPDRRFSWLRGLGWAAAGACAAFAAMRAPELFRAPSSSGPNPQTPMFAADFQPNASSRELLEARDEGLLYDDEDAPQRQVRLTFLERHTWTNPATGAVLQFEVPREDVVLTPVALQ